MFVWLSSFLMNPALAAGAGAVAGPLLIHILSRRRFRRVRWAAMEFLLAAQRQNRRRVRMEQLLLLFLRCLAVLLIAFMMMRPFVRAGAFSAILGGAARTERIVILDDSFSMGYRPSVGTAAGRSVFERAVDATLQLARLSAEDSPEDSFTVVLTSLPGEPAAAIAGLSDENIERLRLKLAGLRPSVFRSAMDVAVERVADMIARSARQANSAVYIVSDFQRSDWIQHGSANTDGENARPLESTRSVLSPLTALTRGGSRLKAVLLNVGDAMAENAAVTGIASMRPQCVAGVPARFEASIVNNTRSPLENIELSVSIAEQRLAPVHINRILPGQTLQEPIEVTFPSEGANYVNVELVGADRRGDTVRLDNVRAAAVNVLPAIQVLIVDGEPNNDPYRDEVYLLRTALRPAGRAASGNELTVMDEQEAESAELESYQVVILANVGRPSPAMIRNLEEFVRRGGGLIVFAGDQMDLDGYANDLYRGGRGLLPVRIRDLAEAPKGAGPTTFGSWDSTHPLMRAFDGPVGALLRQVRVDAYVTSEPPDEAVSNATGQASPVNAPGEKPGDADSTSSAAEESPPTRIIARLNDDDATPLIAEKRLGSGVCVFVATSADQEWNDWASNFSYLPMMLELVQYTARSAVPMSQVTVGGPLICEYDPSRFSARATVRTPSYPVEPEVEVEATTGSRPVFEYRGARECGIFEFGLSTTAGNSVKRFAAVNPNPMESNFVSAGKSELDAALVDDLPYDYVADVRVLSEQGTAARHEYWWPALIAAVMVLMSEQWLAWWFGRRG